MRRQRNPKSHQQNTTAIKRERTLDLRILFTITETTSTSARTSKKLYYTSGNGTRPPQPVLFLLADRSHLLDLSAPVHASTLKSCPPKAVHLLLPLVHDITTGTVGFNDFVNTGLRVSLNPSRSSFVDTRPPPHSLPPKTETRTSVDFVECSIFPCRPLNLPPRGT